MLQERTSLQSKRRIIFQDSTPISNLAINLRHQKNDNNARDCPHESMSNICPKRPTRHIPSNTKIGRISKRSRHTQAIRLGSTTTSIFLLPNNRHRSTVPILTFTPTKKRKVYPHCPWIKAVWSTSKFRTISKTKSQLKTSPRTVKGQKEERNSFTNRPRT